MLTTPAAQALQALSSCSLKDLHRRRADGGRNIDTLYEVPKAAAVAGHHTHCSVL